MYDKPTPVTAFEQPLDAIEHSLATTGVMSQRDFEQYLAVDRAEWISVTDEALLEVLGFVPNGVEHPFTVGQLMARMRHGATEEYPEPTPQDVANSLSFYADSEAGLGQGNTNVLTVLIAAMDKTGKLTEDGIVAIQSAAEKGIAKQKEIHQPGRNDEEVAARQASFNRVLQLTGSLLEARSK